jgi:hypothetical protein
MGRGRGEGIDRRAQSARPGWYGARRRRRRKETDVNEVREAGYPGTAFVHYGQIALVDGEGDDPEWDCLRESSVGIIGVQPGSALLLTGRHTGEVGFVVQVTQHDPGADLDGYEDVVEISYSSRDGQAALMEFAGENAHDLPPLPAGAGDYRLRYHARGMDEGKAADGDEGPVDEYLLQIWPAAPTPAVTLKRTSQQCAYWQDEANA